ncbi:MAG TPA: thiamine phosphate synthase [Candidatus Binatia bacterium]|nr:thiamine phosphate synthase [Candidatus Binatia bacterium]
MGDELRLCLVTDRTQTRDRDLITVVGECLAAGLPAVQVREKDLPAAELARLGRALRALTAARGALLIVNDRVDVALAVGADAVQRTSMSLPIEDIRAVADKRLRIGASVHGLEEALAAQEAGADWLVFGPVYDTPSKRRYGPPQGLGALRRVAAATRLPVVAIGGITPERVREVREAGAAGVAVISAILTAERPGDATRRFLDALAA